MGIDRRSFLRRTGLLGTAAVLGEPLLSACAPPVDLDGVGREYHPSFVPRGSILDLPASEAPIDHIVILMMENRSFDHYLGWLGRDAGYLERGSRKYGSTFRIDARSHTEHTAPDGTRVASFHLPSDEMPNPWRGCGFEDPGHGWTAGRAQRDGGFLAEGSDNDRFALGYYEAADLPFTSRLARRFTTFDRYHCSVLGPTQPNREYLHGAQSGGHKNNYLPIRELGFQWDTIWDRLRAARVPVRSYFSDLPSLAMWGPRMGDIVSPIDQYFSDCQAGRLPSVTFLDPPYAPWWQADDHPHADVGAGQRFLRDTFRAFARSRHWESGLFILTYDEWGGFADHVAPPVLPDSRASSVDSENFGQAGFRVPTVLASPYARPGYVDHRTYDHTSITRFLEWRFLGAPPEGPGSGSAPWALTLRDRHANNIGASLGASGSDPELFDLEDLPLRAPTADCDGTPYIGPPGTQPPPSTTTTTAPPPRRSMTAERTAADRDPAMPAAAQVRVVDGAPTGGPGSDLIDALESGYFERVGIDATPSDVAGTWSEGGSI